MRDATVIIFWLEREQGSEKEVWKLQGSHCYSNELLAT